LPGPSIDVHRVKQIIAAVYERSPRDSTLTSDTLGDDQPLYSLEPGQESLGLDSLDAVEIATELEEAFDVVMPVEIDPAELLTVRQVVQMLERLVREQHGGGS
jgi:acyl carrier protein